MDGPVAGIEEARHVLRGRGRGKPSSLVRLVPDRPPAHFRVALRHGSGERGEVGPPRRRHVRLAAAVRPPRRSVERDDGLDPRREERVQDAVRRGPVEGVPLPLNLIPAHRHAHDPEPETLQRGDAMIDSARAELEPGVVLNAVGDGGAPRAVVDIATAASAARRTTARRRIFCSPPGSRNTIPDNSAPPQFDS